jgi:hypothetical protein
VSTTTKSPGTPELPEPDALLHVTSVFTVLVRLIAKQLPIPGLRLSCTPDLLGVHERLRTLLLPGEHIDIDESAALRCS